MSDTWNTVPEGKVLVSRTASPSSDGAYHTQVCYLVRDSHISRSEQWADRSRFDECQICQRGGPIEERDGYNSLAREIRSRE